VRGDTAGTPRGVQRPQLAHLFKEHAPFLLRVVERMTGQGPHVEDIVQETFVTAAQKLGALPLDTPWRGWLVRVSVNHVRHHRRAFARRAQLSQQVDHVAARPVASPR
jgi:RNA polymerase sigma factor (sigma-70 family)